MLTLEEKLRSTHRYAELNDFRLGLNYEIVSPLSGGRRHTFIKKTIKAENFVNQCREFQNHLNQRLALVPIDLDEVSEDYSDAQDQLKNDAEFQKLLKNFPEKEEPDGRNTNSPVKEQKQKGRRK